METSIIQPKDLYGKFLLPSLAFLASALMFLSSILALPIQMDVQLIFKFWEALLLSSAILLSVSAFRAARGNPTSIQMIKDPKKIRFLIVDILLLLTIFLISFAELIDPKFAINFEGLDATFSYEMIYSLIIFASSILIAKDSIDLIYSYHQRGREVLIVLYIRLFAIIAILILGLIFFTILYKGIGAISWEFLSQPHSKLGREGGIVTCIEGTFWAVLIATLVSAPLGIGSGIYLHEYSKSGRISRLVTIAVSCLNGVPSIVYGLFGLALLVPIFGVSLVVGSIILGLMNLPTIILTTQESLKSVPNSLREGSAALGATKWQTVQKIILPSAMSGILTGLIVSVARAAGETAPIMWIVVFTAAPVEKIYGFIPDVTQPVNNLCFHLLQLIYFMGAWNVETNAWGTALVLLGLVLAMNLIAIIIRNHYRKKVSW